MGTNITIVGVGYVGLVSGACFAEFGHNVICVDIDESKIERLKKGIMPIYEPGLDHIVEQHSRSGRLTFTTDLAQSVKGRDAIFIAVGTPTRAEDGHADLSYVYAAAKNIAEALDQFTVVVTKSTVPVGANREIARILGENAPAGRQWAVASNPEFLREGAAISDFMEPDRVVIGCNNPRGIAILERIYAPLAARNTPIVTTDIETAELIKYAANAFLAVKVSFINEVSDLCEQVGGRVEEVAKGIGLDHRIGGSFLRTGPGWGGSCFPKDTRAMLMTAQDAGVPLRIVSAAVRANEERKRDMINRVIEACDGSVKGLVIGVLGLTFKGQTDDMRESPSLDILPGLIAAGAKVRAFDPSNPQEASSLLPGVELVGTPVDAAIGADALLVLTEWMVFKSYDLGELARVMRRRVMIDLRNLFNETAAREGGFTIYHCLGQHTAIPRLAKVS